MEPRNHVMVGGNSGIGLEIVKRLVRNGDRIWTFSRSAVPSESGAGITSQQLDITRDSLPVEVLPDAVDGLVYCPGTIRLRPIGRLTEEDFIDDFQMNVLGAVRSIQALLPRLKKSRSGAAIVLFSTVAVQTGMPFHASIASAKGAVEGLTRSLAAEFAPRIRVNAIAPSLTDTPLAEPLLSSEERRKSAADRHPLKRIGRPAELADAAVFLLSDSASWITGQIIPIDGGMSSLRTFR